MSISLLFWIIYLIALLFSVWSSWHARNLGNTVPIWILIGLLGWQVFGPAIHK